MRKFRRPAPSSFREPSSSGAAPSACKNSRLKTKSPGSIYTEPGLAFAAKSLTLSDESGQNPSVSRCDFSHRFEETERRPRERTYGEPYLLPKQIVLPFLLERR